MDGKITGFLDEISAALSALVRAAATVEECSWVVAWSAIVCAALLAVIAIALILNLFQDRRCCCCRAKESEASDHQTQPAGRRPPLADHAAMPRPEW